MSVQGQAFQKTEWHPLWMVVHYMRTKYEIDSQECLQVSYKSTNWATIYCFLGFSEVQLLYRATIQVYYYTLVPHFRQGPNFLSGWDQLVPEPYTPLQADTPFIYFITNTVCIHGILFASVEKRSFVMVQRDICYHGSLLLGKGRGKTTQTQNIHTQTLQSLHSRHLTPIVYNEIYA